jgi:hypothetical protein
VGLVARRSPGAHLAHGHLHLDRREQRDDSGQFRRRGPTDQAHHLGPWHIDVDGHPGQGRIVERHRLRRGLEIQSVACDELVDDVEVLGRLAVELDDDPVADHERRLGVVRTAHRDQAEFRVGDGKAVEVHRFRVKDAHPP